MSKEMKNNLPQMPCGLHLSDGKNFRSMPDDVDDLFIVPTLCEDGSTKHVVHSTREDLKKFKCSDFAISNLKKNGVVLSPMTLDPSQADLDNLERHASDLQEKFATDPLSFYDVNNEPKN